MTSVSTLSAPRPQAAATAAPAIDLAALKARQQATWSAGDFAVIGSTLQIVGETLCEAVDLRAGERVLDVAAGNGNATLAAARRFGAVTSTDYVPALLEKGRARAAAEGLEVAFRVADAEALPFADASFDVVLSTFGAMFTADQARAAGEMLRVCRPGGGRIGLANWTPEGLIGQLFRVIGRHVPPMPGTPSPAVWGTPEGLRALFGDGAAGIAVAERDFVFRYRSPGHWLEVFRTWYGPVLRAFEAHDAAGQRALEADILALLGRFNRATDGTLVAPAAYLEVVVTTTGRG
jgi:SAM-dependent methyltransferase